MPPTVPKPRPATVWISRDSDEGGPSPIIKVWLDRPVKMRWASGYYWRCLDPQSFWCSYSVDDALKIYRTIPDDAHMLIRNGNV